MSTGVTFGFNLPYGSSSLGLKTLKPYSVTTRNSISPVNIRDCLHLTVHFGSGKVGSRGAFGDHLGMDAFANGCLDGL